MVFVLDTSGSMASTSIRQAKAALALALHRLDAGDRFNVIEFDSDARALFESAREATARNVDEALDWLDSLEARGGTEILPALELALRGDAPAGFLRQIVFLTDGAVANEEELLAHVRAGLRESRIFAVGIGSAPNGYLMRKLAELGRGSFTHIGKPEEVAERMEALLRKLDTVALSDIELVLPRGVDVEAYPNPLPDLYEGEPVVVALELDAPLAWASVRGMRGDEPWESIVGRRDEEQRPGVHVLWARRKIDALMHRPGPGSTAVLTERRRLATAVALAHQLVSRFTSLVVVDRTPVRRDNEELRTRPLAARLPAGADAARYFGFEQGASAAPLHRILGLALLCAASIAARLRNPRRGVSS
jgi:Ca-activated chloride channel family protein